MKLAPNLSTHLVVSLYVCLTAGCGSGVHRNPGGADAGPDGVDAATGSGDADAPAGSDGSTALPNTSSLAFDGIDDHVRVPGAESLRNFTGITIEAWARPTSSTGERAIIGKMFDGSNWEFGLLRRPDGAPYFEWSCGVACGYLLKSGNAAFPLDQWTHIAGTWSSTESNLYVNGSQASTGTGGVPGLANTLNALLIGAAELEGVPARHWQGGIDEVRIWNVVRTQAQIQADMDRALVGNEPGLVGYWNAEDGAGDTLQDATTHANDGRLGASTGADAADPAWDTATPF